MIVKFFGVARLQLQVAQYEIDEAKNVKELLVKIAEKSGKIEAKQLQGFLIYVNEVPISDLKGFRTLLKSDDVIYLMSPASGG